MLIGRRCGGTGAMSVPSSRMLPSSGVSKPASMRNKVLLPQPDGPSSAKNSPARISRERLLTATTPPNRLVTDAMRNNGASPPDFSGAGASAVGKA